MKIMVCLDDRNAMCFGGRRLSRDRNLLPVFREYVGDSVLRMHPYSSSLFAKSGMTVAAQEDYLAVAAAEDVCFVEREQVAAYLDRITECAVCYWNRVYPGDVFWDVQLDDWEVVSEQELAGYSHEKLLFRVYRKPAPAEAIRAGEVPAEVTRTGNVPAEATRAGEAPVEATGTGNVPAEATRAGEAPAEVAESGEVPVGAEQAGDQ